jgi:hypothetical protein
MERITRLNRDLLLLGVVASEAFDSENQYKNFDIFLKFKEILYFLLL